ncbi:MAG: TIM barrel protein [Spirochaetales bacterium]
MKPLIGVNLYSVREHCRTEADLEATLRRLKAIGYPSVQVSGIAPLPFPRVRELLDKAGLVACAAHDNLEALTQRPGEVIEKLRALGCHFTALGYPGDEMMKPENLPLLRDQLTVAGKALAAAGLRLGYHNHAIEFAPIPGTTGPATSIYAWLYAQIPATVLGAEPDTAWIQAGGGSPSAWLRRLEGRVDAVHLKDYTWTPGRPQFCEVGHGNLDFDSIFAALHETQVPIWIVEQDDPVPGRDIFDSLAMSFERVAREG